MSYHWIIYIEAKFLNVLYRLLVVFVIINEANPGVINDPSKDVEDETKSRPNSVQGRQQDGKVKPVNENSKFKFISWIHTYKKYNKIMFITKILKIDKQKIS